MDDKYLILICFVLIAYLFYKQCQQTEPMANLDNDQIEQVKKLIYETYKIDVNSIRNLSEVATKLQKEGLTIPGNLTVTGNAIMSGPTSLNTLTATGNSKLNSLEVKTIKKIFIGLIKFFIRAKK